jgi:hypothetical protein
MSNHITPSDVAGQRQYDPNTSGQLRRYETKIQKDVEQSNALYFLQNVLGPMYRCNLELKSLSLYEAIDYSVHEHNGRFTESQVKAFIECKSHNLQYNPNKNYILNYKNWKVMCEVFRYAPVYLLAGFSGQLYYWQFDPNVSHTMHAGGRKDRKDPNDIVLKINFSNKVFTPVW